MGLFKRGKKGRGKSGGDSTDSTDAPPNTAADGSTVETSPQKVGVVSGVLSTTAETGERGSSLFGDVVSRRFAPNDDEGDGRDLPPRYEVESMNEETPNEENPSEAADEPTSRDHLRAVAPLFPDHPATPDLEVDPMAHIGRATTITGNIVADEDLEIQGIVEGSVRLANHQVTIGAEGHVKASVDAEIVMVYGRITGDVIASDLVEIEKGGIVGGDIRAPRIVMHDGAIVVGGLDMSAALPNGGANFEASEEPDSSHPHLASVTPVAPIASAETDAEGDPEDRETSTDD